MDKRQNTTPEFLDSRSTSHQWRVQTDVTLPAASAQQLAPPGVGVLAFQQPSGEASGPPLRLVQPEPLPSGVSVVRLAGEICRQADLRGELALVLLKRLL